MPYLIFLCSLRLLQPTKGAEVLELAFRRFPDAISSEDVHMLLEIQVRCDLAGNERDRQRRIRDNSTRRST